MVVFRYPGTRYQRNPVHFLPTLVVHKFFDNLGGSGAISLNDTLVKFSIKMNNTGDLRLKSFSDVLNVESVSPINYQFRVFCVFLCHKNLDNFN